MLFRNRIIRKDIVNTLNHELIGLLEIDETFYRNVTHIILTYTYLTITLTYHSKTLLLTDIKVHPYRQNKGVATTIISQLSVVAKKNKVDFIVAPISSSIIRSIVTKQGFLVEGDSAIKYYNKLS